MNLTMRVLGAWEVGARVAPGGRDGVSEGPGDWQKQAGLSRRREG